MICTTLSPVIFLSTFKVEINSDLHTQNRTLQEINLFNSKPLSQESFLKSNQSLKTLERPRNEVVQLKFYSFDKILVMLYSELQKQCSRGTKSLRHHSLPGLQKPTSLYSKKAWQFVKVDKWSRLSGNTSIRVDPWSKQKIIIQL